MKRILAAVWKLNFLGEEANLERLRREVVCEPAGELELMLKRGLVARKGTGYFLTPAGRRSLRIVLAGGVFDILHPGHVFFLERAKEKGDVLVAVVARDSTVARRKRIPIVPEEQRVEMVAALKPVDVALLGDEGDIYATVEKVEPDVIALGPNQTHREDELRGELKKRGISCEIVRVREYRECRLPSTRSILQRIIELNFPDQRLEGKR